MTAIPSSARTAIDSPTPAVTSDRALPRRNYLNAGYGLRSWLLTRDHKRIAILYLISVTTFFFLGGICLYFVREKPSETIHRGFQISQNLRYFVQLSRENPNHLNGIWWDEISRLYARMRAGGRIDLLDHHLGADGLDITQFPPLPKKN